ncbi:PBS lyase HEAT-like repeat protein [Stutzerimonas stutzeri DSM 10701]|nr:PBS lyase HEAT-like repeat protein [Stutzerimonas stutzeri DSM 10701]
MERQGAAQSWAERRRVEALELVAQAGSDAAWVDLSRHYNGFVREVAVRELNRTRSPDALVALIDRLNDWVPQVRDLAAAGLKQYLSPSQAPALLAALEPLIALEARQRVDHEPTLMAARTVLQSPLVREEVYRHFLTRQGKAARYLFDLLLECGAEPEALLRSALAHRELTVRLMAVAACKQLPAYQARPLLAEALSRPGASVRVCVLRALLPLLDDPREVLRNALLDPSRGVRGFARWAAPRNGLDAAVILAERLQGDMPVTKRGWLGILGLADDLSVELDMQWLEKALRSGYPAVRESAVLQLRDDHLSLLLGMLDDPADRVFSTSVARLGKQPWSSLKELDSKLSQRWHALPAARREAILRLMPAWQQLAFLLTRLEAETDLQVFWLRQLAYWCDRQYLMVDPVTPRIEREAAAEKLMQLAAQGLLSIEKVQRIL